MCTLWHTRMMMWDGSKLWISIIMAVKKATTDPEIQLGGARNLTFLQLRDSCHFLYQILQDKGSTWPLCPHLTFATENRPFTTNRQHDTTRVFVFKCIMSIRVHNTRQENFYTLQPNSTPPNLSSTRIVDHTIENTGISDGCMDF